MHELSFADAARPTPVVCLRLRLHPYTLGHELLLLRRRNALFLLSQPEFDQLGLAAQIAALRDAVLICSQNWESSQKRQSGLLIWSWMTRNVDYALEIAEFRNYLAEAHIVMPPPTAEADEIANGKPPSGRSPGAPYLAQLINFASERCFVFGVKSVFDVPYALCGSLYFSKLESDGAYRIENHKEAETRERLEKIRAEYAAEQEGLKKNSPADGPETSNAGLATVPPDLN